MYQAETKVLTLTGNEVVFLADAVRNGVTIKGVEDELSSTKGLIVKLGSLYRELVSIKGILEGPLSIAVSLEEAWTLRGCVFTSALALDGQTNNGINLSIKLYEILSRFTDGELEIDLSNFREWIDADREPSSDPSGKPEPDAG